jgi:gluconate 2-dehydrogenase gamma chain
MQKHDVIGRSEMMKRVGIMVGLAAWPASGWITWAAPVAKLKAPAFQGPVSLSRSQYELLDAICARLIPSGDGSPGAREAMAARYIDRALSGAVTSSRGAYETGLNALDGQAQASKQAPFVNLPPEDQDALLMALQDNPATTPFFNLVRTHTIQGVFSDPYYGGNANFTGWDMIGYPGVRFSVGAELMEMGADHKPNHVSAYDSSMFEKGEV